jgi:hypothetical protein
MISAVALPERLPLIAVPNAAAAYALRKINPAYAGNCIRVRESAGNTEANIGFDANGDLDKAAMLSHCGANSGYVVTWFDQSGNAVDVTQATAGSQPQIVSSGVILANGSSPKIRFSTQTLAGTLGSAIAANSFTVAGVVKNNQPTLDTNRVPFVTVNNAGSPCWQLRFNGQGLNTITYSTPGGSVTQTSDNVDIPMIWSRMGFVAITSATAVSHWRNDVVLESVAHAFTGASGTQLILGTSTATWSVEIAELLIYGAELSQPQIAAVYDAVNAYQLTGPLERNETVTLEERLPWDRVLREWVQSRNTADRTVNIGTITWDDTYADTDELLRIYLTITEYDNESGHELEGLRCDQRWFQWIADEAGYGMESTPLEVLPTAINAPGDLRQFYKANHGSQAGSWAEWYALSVPKAGGVQGNPFYHQRGVAVRALIESIYTGIQICKEVDKDQSYGASWDIAGGVYNGVLATYRLCRQELPTHVQHAYREMLRYMVHRLYLQPVRAVNSNMECKGIEFIVTAYALIDDQPTRAECIAGVKRMLFGSETGTPETANSMGLYSDAGHIKEGNVGLGTPETTYNGHSTYHLVAGLSHVRGDSNWAFLATVLDRMARFKYEQHVVQPDGSFDGPSGYAGRTGGSRVNDIGFDNSTYQAWASFSTYARPGGKTLGNEAALIAAINSAITLLNGYFAESLTILTGTGLHTNNRQVNPFAVTAQVNPANTLTATGHGLQADDRVRIQALSSAWVPGGLSSTVTYYVVNVVGDTFQVSLTSGGAPISITSSGTSPIRCSPAVYLGGAPNLAYSTTAAAEAFVSGTYLGNEFIRRIAAVDNTDKLLFIHGPLQIPSASAIDYTIENGPKRWIVGINQHWTSRWTSYPDNGYFDAQRARIVANDDTLKTPWELTADFNVNRGNEFWLYKAKDGATREFGWMIEALAVVGSYDGWFGGTLQHFWTRETGFLSKSSHDKSGDQITQDENTRTYNQIDEWATSHIWIKDDTGMRWSSASENNNPTAVSWDIDGTPKSLSVDRTFTHGTATYGEKTPSEYEGSEGATGSVTVQIDPTNTLTHNGHELQDDDAVKLTGTLPSPVVSGTRYYVVNRTANTFQLSATRGGAPITITTTGSGVAYVQRISMNGTSVVSSAFTALADGLQHTYTLSYTGTDYAKEIWATIPIFLRDGDQAASTETTIEYWNGTSWSPLTTNLSFFQWLRIGRDFGSGKAYVWLEFWDPSTPCKLSDAVWVQSYQANGRFRNIKLDMLGYTGAAKQIPASTTVWYKLHTVDPGFVATAPSLSIVYPTPATVWPEGGILGVKATVDWIGAAGTVTAEYRINAAAWTSLGTLTNTTGNIYEYVGGTVPANMVEMRVKATPGVGTESLQIVTTYSAPYLLKVEDNFTAADTTVIDGSYSSWTTNTTGNVYLLPVGTAEVSGNKAVAVSPTTGFGAYRFIDCDQENNLMVEAVAIAGTSGDSNVPGTGVSARCRLSTANELVCAVVLQSGGAFQIRESRDGSPLLLKSQAYGSYSNTNPYRIRMQLTYPYVAARYNDINNGDALAAEFGGFTLATSLGVERQGNGFLVRLNGSSIDALKIWTPDPTWTPPTILPPEEDPDPPSIFPEVTILHPTTALVLPEGGAWAIRVSINWNGLTPATVQSQYTINGTDWLDIWALLGEGDATHYRYAGGTIPAGVTAIRVTATPTEQTQGTDTEQVAVTTAATTLVLSDAFTGANNTSLGASWSGWQTNTTGNSYATINGTMQINANLAIGTNSSSSGNINRINVNSASMIVEGEIKTGTNLLTTGIGVAARINGIAQSVIACLANTSSTTGCFIVKDLGGTVATETADYASWNLANFYRIKLQVCGDAAVAQFYDIANGNTLAGTISLFGLVNWNAVTYGGWYLGRSQQASRADNFKIWTF